jgi:hypothetical protein
LRSVVMGLVRAYGLGCTGYGGIRGQVFGFMLGLRDFGLKFGVHVVGFWGSGVLVQGSVCRC